MNEQNRVVTSALQLGVVGSVVSTYFFGLDISIPFLFGSGAGAIYLYLLGKLTDSIGAGKMLFLSNFLSNYT